MTPGKIETVRRLFELFNEGFDDVPTELVSPEVVIVSPLSEMRGGPYRGYDEARQWLADVREQFGRWEYEIAEIRETDDSVVATGHVHVEGRASGVELDPEMQWIFYFAEDGRISKTDVSMPSAGLG